MQINGITELLRDHHEQALTEARLKKHQKQEEVLQTATDELAIQQVSTVKRNLMHKQVKSMVAQTLLMLKTDGDTSRQ